MSGKTCDEKPHVEVRSGHERFLSQELQIGLDRPHVTSFGSVTVVLDGQPLLVSHCQLSVQSVVRVPGVFLVTVPSLHFSPPNLVFRGKWLPTVPPNRLPRWWTNVSSVLVQAMGQSDGVVRSRT